MKKLTKQLSAILAAAVMTVSAAGISASADSEPYLTGWINRDKAWFYYLDDNAVAQKNYEIDGILYSFAEDGCCTGKYSGWTKQDGVKRRYSEGLPYTGWLKNKDGTKKYCLDGYLVTGNFQIGDKLYGFDKNGIYTGKSKRLNLTASCGNKIPCDMKKITVTVQYHDGNDDKGYAVGEPAKMERWEKGKWVDCIGKSVEYAVNDIAYALGGLGDCSVNFTEVPFYRQTYIGNDWDLNLGYYRITVPCGEDGNYLNTEKNLYAIFEVVPPVEAKMSEEVYISEDSADIEFQAYVTLNSKELADKKVALRIYKRTERGWETALKEYDKSISCDSVSANGMISIDGYLPFEEGCYYYHTVVDAEGKQHGVTYWGETYFRVEAR